MYFLKSVVSFLFCVQISEAAVCKLPSIPENLVTQVSINMVQGFAENKTHAFLEYLDTKNQRCMIQSYMEINFLEESNKIFEDWLIWDSSLDGFENFLLIRKDHRGHLSCLADKIENQELFEFLTGFGGQTKFPSVINMLHFGGDHDYECWNGDMVDGVPVRTFTTLWFQTEDLPFTFNITYYWTDPDIWVGTAGNGQSVPIKATIFGTYTSNNHTKDAHFDIVFSSFMEIQYPDKFNWLRLFPAIPCKGRDQILDAHSFPDTFTFSFESYEKIKIGQSEMNLVLPGKEFYNFRTKLSRTDIAFRLPSKPETVTYITNIKDFTTGIVYTIISDEGECSIHHIDGLDIDEIILSNGTVQIASSAEFWNTNANFSYNGQVKLRGINADVFVSTNEKTQRSFALYLSSGDSSQADNDGFLFNVPLKIEKFQALDYGNTENILTRNIEGFSVALNNFKIFDVTRCFSDKQKRRKVIRFPWKSNLDVLGQLSFVEDEIRNAASRLSKIEPIRIQNIEISISEEHGYVYFFFTILDMPNVDSRNKIGSLYNQTLDQAIEELKKEINIGNFIIFIPLVGGEMIDVEAESNFFKNVDGKDDTSPYKPLDYSPGSMAGLGIGMIILGLLLGCIVTYFVEIRRNKGSPFPNRMTFSKSTGIENPNYK